MFDGAQGSQYWAAHRAFTEYRAERTVSEHTGEHQDDSHWAGETQFLKRGIVLVITL